MGELNCDQLSAAFDELYASNMLRTASVLLGSRYG